MEIIIGKIVNTKGLKGEVKILSNSDFKEERFKKGNEILIKYQNEFIKMKITSWKTHKNTDILKFENYDNINKIEKYKGCNIYAEKIKDDNLKDDQYLLDELLNYEIIENSNTLGLVVKVYNLVNRTYIDVKLGNGATKKIPFIKPFIQKVDKNNKTIEIQSISGLLDD